MIEGIQYIKKHSAGVDLLQNTAILFSADISQFLSKESYLFVQQHDQSPMQRSNTIPTIEKNALNFQRTSRDEKCPTLISAQFRQTLRTFQKFYTFQTISKEFLAVILVVHINTSKIPANVEMEITYLSELYLGSSRARTVLVLVLEKESLDIFKSLVGKSYSSFEKKPVCCALLCSQIQFICQIL